MPFGALVVAYKRSAGVTVNPVRAFETVGRDADHPRVTSSAAGGLLLDLLSSPCSFGDEAFTGICVRQPNGTFSSFSGAVGAEWPNAVLPGSRLFPLADGRLARVFGSYTQGGVGSDPLRVETLGPAGEHTVLPPFRIPFPRGSLVQVSGIDEVSGAIDVAFMASHTRDPHRAKAEDNPGFSTAWLARQPLAGGLATTREIHDADRVAIGHGHAIAVLGDHGPRRVVISNDGGATVFEETLPGALHWIKNVVANDVGGLIDGDDGDGWLRVGWNPLDPDDLPVGG